MSTLPIGSTYAGPQKNYPASSIATARNAAATNKKKIDLYYQNEKTKALTFDFNNPNITAEQKAKIKEQLKISTDTAKLIELELATIEKEGKAITANNMKK